MGGHADNRDLLKGFRAAQYDWDETGLRAVLEGISAPDTIFRLAHPFGDMTGPSAFHDNALAVLKAASSVITF